MTEEMFISGLIVLAVTYSALMIAVIVVAVKVPLPMFGARAPKPTSPPPWTSPDKGKRSLG